MPQKTISYKITLLSDLLAEIKSINFELVFKESGDKVEDSNKFIYEGKSVLNEHTKIGFPFNGEISKS